MDVRQRQQSKASMCMHAHALASVECVSMYSSCRRREEIWINLLVDHSKFLLLFGLDLCLLVRCLAHGLDVLLLVLQLHSEMIYLICARLELGFYVEDVEQVAG